MPSCDPSNPITWYQYPQASFQNLPLSRKQFSLVIWLSQLPKCKCLMVSLFGRILASAPVSMSSLARGSVAASLRSTTQGSTRLANYSLMYFLYFEFCISCILYFLYFVLVHLSIKPGVPLVPRQESTNAAPEN